MSKQEVLERVGGASDRENIAAEAEDATGTEAALGRWENEEEPYCLGESGGSEE